MIPTPMLLLLLGFAPAAQPDTSPAPASPVSAPAPSAPAPSAPAVPLPHAGATPPPAQPGVSPTSLAPPSSPAASNSPEIPPVVPTPLPYKYRFVPRHPATTAPGEPLITAVYLNDGHLHSRGTILIRVETNDAVIKVVSVSNGRVGEIPKVAPGAFEAAGKLPKLPFIAAGMTVQIEFVATAANGRKTSVRVPVKLD